MTSTTEGVKLEVDSGYEHRTVRKTPVHAKPPREEYVARVDIGVLGPVEARVAGHSVELGGPKQRALFGLLVAAAPGAVSTDALIEGIWGEEPSSGARSTLQTYVSNLRQVLGEELTHERGSYRLNVKPDSVDSTRFQQLLEEGRSALATDAAGTTRVLREALNLWRGRPYADLIDFPGLEPEVRRLEELRLEAVELRIDAELASGLHGGLVAELEALAEEHPLRERFRAQHMLALYRSGRQAEALRAYRKTESMLADELGVEPSQELQDLELAILQHDDALLGGVGRAVTQRLAFLVTDIEASTRLWDRNPQEMADALAVHDRLLREAIEAESGTVFKHTGDGVLAAFPGALKAVKAAEATLRSLAASDWGEVGDLRVRMGIDVGEVEARGGDFFGPPVNRAARLCAIAHGGQVLVSASAQSEVSAAAPTGLQVRHLGEFHLRGMASPERVSQLVFVGLPADFPELRMDAESALDDRVEVVSLPGYEVRERIGEGAFGVVWRAYQPSVGREVAIKVIRPELASQPSFVRRFEAEARTIARVAHPHIVPLIDFWRDADSAYLVLGLLPGGSLAEASAKGGIDRSAARRILTQVGTALDHAHSQGLAHGDLKPANVLLDGAGNAYLSDFGIAARLLYPEVVSSLSSESSYRAPEEMEGGPSPAGDLYALGTLVGELLDGIPEAGAVLSRATAATPGDRYPSAAALLAELDQALGEEPVEVEPPVVSRNPYKGLRAFDEADAADFFGREELVATLLAAVAEHRFVAVVGPSGSGKSSVVRAGLIPALARGDVEGSERWLHTVLTPGSDPLQSVADALQTVSTRPVTAESVEETGLETSVDGDVVLVVDQFEELYTMVDDADVRGRFIDLLVSAAEDGSRVRVVATLRADFYDRPLEDERLGRLVRDGLVTVLPPTREGLVEMITAPSQAVGLRWEPGLAHRIAEDVAHQPGSLPLLQYALTELVERRSGDLLTAIDYTRVGGVAGALATRAEDVYRDLTPSQQEAARQVMLRLVTVDEDSDDTRRRVRRSELESVGIPRSDLETVLDTLTTQRLLLADRDPATRGPTVEVAHEALLREWPRLAGWVDDQREALILGRRFRAALADWDHNHRHDDYLLTGSRLAPFTGWAETAALTAEEQNYYQASQNKDQEQRAARRRRRRTLTGILASAAVVASTLGIIALVQANRATDQADRALAAEARAEEEAERATAEADRANDEAARAQEEADRAARESDRARASELSAFATAVLSEDPALSKLLVLEALNHAAPTIETLAVLHEVFAADVVTDRYTWSFGTMSADLHPSEDLLAVSGGSGGGTISLEVVDLTADEVVWAIDVTEMTSVDDSASTLAIGVPFFSVTGTTVMAGIYRLTGDDISAEERAVLGIHVWATETGEHLDQFDIGDCGGWIGDVSLDYIAVKAPYCVGGAPFQDAGINSLIDLETGDSLVLTPAGTTNTDVGVALSGDGRYVGFNENVNGTWHIVVEDVGTGERVLDEIWDQFDQDEFTVHDLNEDGSLLAVGQRPLHVWNVPEARVIASVLPVDSTVGEFANTGSVLYAITRDSALHQFDATSGAELNTFPAVGVERIATTDNGLLVSGNDMASKVQPLRGEIGVLPTPVGFALAWSLHTAGQHGVYSIAVDSVANTYVFDVHQLEVLHELPHQDGQQAALSPDGLLIVRQETLEGNVSPLLLYDAESGEHVADLEGCVWDIDLLFSEGVPREESGSCASDRDALPLYIDRLVWSPNGKMIAGLDHPASVFQGSGEVAVWNADTGELLWRHHGSDKVRDAVFTPDSSRVSVSYYGGLVRVFSTSTWQELMQADLGGLQGGGSLGFAGYTGDASSVIAIGNLAGAGAGSLHWLNAETMELEFSVDNAHEGSPKAMDFSPDHSLLATGASDGLVKVWDADTGRLVHEIPVTDGEVQGLAFLTNEHILVLPQGGNLRAFTIDPDELIGITHASLTRGFTTLECEKYGFANSCPP